MKRNVDFNEISDGRLYSSGDMVKADCRDCTGCSACCRGMGGSIILDPMDLWRLYRGIHRDFTALMDGYIELGIVDGMILPNIKMDESRDACPFLNEEERCSVHDFRPGICRLFPLGRWYEESGSFRYFLQIHECRKKDRGKVKIKKWLGIPDLKSYESYILVWHDFLIRCENAAETLEEEQVRILTLYVLKRFYESAFYAVDEKGFYEEFYSRIKEAKERLGFE